MLRMLKLPNNRLARLFREAVLAATLIANGITSPTKVQQAFAAAW